MRMTSPALDGRFYLYVVGSTAGEAAARQQGLSGPELVSFTSMRFGGFCFGCLHHPLRIVFSKTSCPN